MTGEEREDRVRQLLEQWGTQWTALEPHLQTLFIQYIDGRVSLEHIVEYTRLRTRIAGNGFTARQLDQIADLDSPKQDN